MSILFSEGQNYCVNCKWHELVDDVDDGHDYKCLHPKNISVDLVTGSIVGGLYHPDFLRGNIQRLEGPSGGCGIEGNWFEKKIE